MSVPSTRLLANVLRESGEPGDTVRMIVATATATAPPAPTHMMVTIEGVELAVPKLKGVTVTAGKPVYILASAGGMVAIGGVSTT